MGLILKAFLKRSIKYWYSLILVGLLVLCILVSLEILAHNHNVRLDLTPAKIYTLSDQTIKILKLLDKDIQLSVFYQQGNRKEYDDFFRLLSSHSPHIKYRLIDLDRNPAQAKLNDVTASGQIIAECEGKKEMVSFPTEEAMMNTILKFTKQWKREIYFITGHGEKEPSKGYFNLVNILELEGWQVRTINLASEEIVSSGTSVVVIGGPQKDFFDPELQKISQYIERGGKVIIMVEPFSRLPKLKKFLEKYQIGLCDGIIVDTKDKLLGGDYLAPLIPYFARSPITESITSPAIFPTACPVVINKEIGSANFTAILAKSSSESWVKREEAEVKRGGIDFKKGIDEKGPIPVAVIALRLGGENSRAGDRGGVVCFGDSDFVHDRFIEMLANKDLFLNTVNYLVKEKDLISIRPKKYEYPYHHMTRRQGQVAFLLLVVVVPGIFMLTGLSVFIYRKWGVVEKK